MPTARRSPFRASPGMTLVELMIVVVIMGILAAVAYTGYGVYIRRSRSQEARAMLLTIASREDAYRAEFATYCAAGRTSGTPPTTLGVGSSWPSAAPGPATADFLTSAPIEWAQLGFRPSGGVRYRYVVITGVPTTAPPGESGWAGSPNQDIWYIAEAYGNLDGGTTLSTYRVFSGNGNRLTITNETE